MSTTEFRASVPPQWRQWRQWSRAGYDVRGRLAEATRRATAPRGDLVRHRSTLTVGDETVSPTDVRRSTTDRDAEPERPATGGSTTSMQPPRILLPHCYGHPPYSS